VATNGPIVHPQVIHEHREPWLNDIDREQLPIRPRELTGNNTAESSSIKTLGTGKGNYKFFLPKYLFHTRKGSLTCRKILRHAADGFTSLRTKECCEFVLPLEDHRPRPGF
jgi:hypothetical protein